VSAPAVRPTRSDYHDDIIYPDAVPFVLVHIACLGAIWTGVSWEMIALCAGLYLAMSLPLSRLARRLERRWKAPGR